MTPLPDSIDETALNSEESTQMVPDSTDETVINSEDNTPLDAVPLPGPPGNGIDISPDGLSELTFGQLLVLFSKIDKAKKQGEYSLI